MIVTGTLAIPRRYIPDKSTLCNHPLTRYIPLRYIVSMSQGGAELVRETAVTRREAHAAARAGFDSPALRRN